METSQKRGDSNRKTKQNEAKRSETKRNKVKRSKTKQNEANNLAWFAIKSQIMSNTDKSNE